MTDLVVRRIPFRFDETTPVQWNPSNPRFALMCDGVSILAIAFEKFIVTVLREVIPTMTDVAAAEEADAFLRQEAGHAKAHRLHLKALIAQHPGLRGTVDDAIAKFDRLVEDEPVEFQLAYIADFEATFTPIFTMMLDHHEELFGTGDDVVASLFLWHFVEEIEHRSSGLIIYDAAVGRPWYRVKVIPRIVAHMADVFTGIMAGLEDHVPASERLVGARAVAEPGGWGEEVRARLPVLRRRAPAGGHPTTFAPVPTGDLLRMVWGLVLSQLPGHRPASFRTPAFADTWFREHAAGRDVTRWYATEPAAAGTGATGTTASTSGTAAVAGG